MVKRMLEADVLKVLSFRNSLDMSAQTISRQAVLNAFLRQHQHDFLARALCLYQRVGKIRMDIQRLVRWNRPWRCRPNHRKYRHIGRQDNCKNFSQFLAILIGKLKADIDGDVFLVRVFDFRFR